MSTVDCPVSSKRLRHLYHATKSSSRTLPEPPFNAHGPGSAIGCIRWICYSAERARQSPGSNDHITTRMLSASASAASDGFLKPNGGRNHFGGAPSAFLIAECVKRSATRISAERFQNKFGCDSM